MSYRERIQILRLVLVYRPSRIGRAIESTPAVLLMTRDRSKDQRRGSPWNRSCQLVRSIVSSVTYRC